MFFGVRSEPPAVERVVVTGTEVVDTFVGIREIGIEFLAVVEVRIIITDFAYRLTQWVVVRLLLLGKLYTAAAALKGTRHHADIAQIIAEEVLVIVVAAAFRNNTLRRGHIPECAGSRIAALRYIRKCSVVIMDVCQHHSLNT